MPKSLRSGLLALALLLPSSAPMAAEPLHVAVSTDVEVAPEEAWKNMSDLTVAHNYVPGLTRTEITTQHSSGVGTSRRVYSEDGEYLEETVTTWDEGRGFTLRLHRGKEPMSPFEQVEFRYHMTPADAETTRVTLALVGQLPLGGFGAWLGDWLARPSMESELTLIAAGLKHYYETGTPASDSDRERLSGAVSVVPTGAGE